MGFQASFWGRYFLISEINSTSFDDRSTKNRRTNAMDSEMEHGAIEGFLESVES